MAITEIPYRKIKIREGDAPRFMSRIYNENGTAITQATLSGGTISFSVFDLKSETPSVAIYTGTISAANCLYDTLQIDTTWDEDEVGYNFAYQFPATYFGASGYSPGRFTLEIRGTPAIGQPFWMGAWMIDVFPMLSA